MCIRDSGSLDYLSDKVRQMFYASTAPDLSGQNLSLIHIFLTAGADYSTVYTPDEVSTLATPKVDVVDTVGAGDAFSAALVMSLLKGQTLREAHECAVKISAFVCSHKGAWPVYE